MLYGRSIFSMSLLAISLGLRANSRDLADMATPLHLTPGRQRWRRKRKGSNRSAAEWGKNTGNTYPRHGRREEIRAAKRLGSTLKIAG